MTQMDLEVQPELDAVRRDFESRLGAMIGDITEAWKKAALSESPDAELKKVGTLAHSLAANAGIFGLRKASCAAKDLEIAVDQRLTATENFESHAKTISERLNDLRIKFAEMK